jgi:predicted choloylglycine hydrolase
VKGKAKHVGFSVFLFGRADGVNEHGVGVSFTGGGIFGVPLARSGFQNHLVIRSILDNCKSVDDAIKLLQKMPVSGFFNLLVADGRSNAALTEFAGGTHDIKQINDDSANQYLFSTNHYVLGKTRKSNEFNCGILKNSRERYQLLTSALKKAKPGISKETLRAILTRKFPDGVCDHYYTDYFGTLWSSVFDLTSRKTEVCFGAPTHNKWQSFTLDEPVGIKKYPATFPDNISGWPY